MKKCFRLNQIVDLDEKNQILTSNMWLSKYHLFDNINKIYVIYQWMLVKAWLKLIWYLHTMNTNIMTFFDSPWLERLFHGMELLWVRWCQGRPTWHKKLFIRKNLQAMTDDNIFLDNIIHRTFAFRQKICGGQTSFYTTGSYLKKENWSLLKNEI